MSSANIKCPICSKTLETAEYEHVKEQLGKSVSQKYREQLRKERQEHADRLARFKKEQQKRIQAMAKRQQIGKKLLQKRLSEQARVSKERYKRGLVQLKKNYQMQLEHLREFYGTQNAALQNELKTSFASQLEAMKKNYESLSASNQQQLESLQKYLEDKLVGELREKVSQLEQDKLATELRLAEVVRQLDERNAQIVSMKERLPNMDTSTPEEHEVDHITSEAPEQAANQELIKMVREVAQQQVLGELKELEEGGEEDGYQEEEKHRFWGSKAGKRFGLF